ncbi:hypothetical protein [Candidatus Nitrosotenuis uzonensis]|uniref:Uncharacterized protein n=1 Tax=Candidatus Nitrosotenuis uzonensis TaxID=1407055 RepID=A0A812EWW7_9ARCH|nr:hypothetical protein [Candidatus Nitrosotenuis uzonensis]CAE6497366.1 conserved hypothetical protein [Candidatus Nitrosotenuis uzonensis]
MTKVERDFMAHVDKLILEASPETLAMLAEMDKRNQLSALTFYDVYLLLSEKDKQILVANNHPKKD